MESKEAGKDKSLFQRTFCSLILYPNYRFLWMTAWTEHMGEWMEQTALLWLLNGMTGSPLWGTLYVSLRNIPTIVFAFIGGIVADRMNRRVLLIWTLSAAAAVSGVTAVLAYTGLLQPWHILVNGGLAGVLTSFNHPARHTLVPNLVKREHLLNAVTLDSGSVTASRIIGAPIAGLLIAILHGSTPVLGVKAIGGAAAILWLRNVEAPPTPPESRKKSPVRNFVQGMKYVGAHRDVLTQVLLYLLPYFVSNTYTGLLPYFATHVLNVGSLYYGFLQAAPGAGALTASLVLASRGNFKRKGLVLLIGGICQGAALVLFAFSPIYILSLCLLVIVGASNTTFMTLNNTVIQELIADEVRGRVMSLREVASGIGPGGSIISGHIAEAVSTPFAMQLAGGFAILVLLCISAVHFQRPSKGSGPAASPDYMNLVAVITMNISRNAGEYDPLSSCP